MATRPILADPFTVWGRPSRSVLANLGKEDQDRLRRYITRVVGKVYRIAYDNGERAGRRKRRRR